MEKKLPTSSRWVSRLQLPQKIQVLWLNLYDSVDNMFILSAGIPGCHTEVLPGRPEGSWFHRSCRGVQRGDQQLGRAADWEWECLYDTKSYQDKLVKQSFDSVSQCSMVALSLYSLSDKIKDLLKPGTVNAMTRLALVNAIYFKGNWMHRFDKANTKEMPFNVKKVKTNI